MTVVIMAIIIVFFKPLTIIQMVFLKNFFGVNSFVQSNVSCILYERCYIHVNIVFISNS